MSKILSKKNITEAIFKEVKSAQEDGITSFECAEEMDMNTEDVIEIYKHTDYSFYRKQVLGEISEGSNEVSPITMAHAAYYKGLVAKKHEETSNLKDNYSLLREQVSFLRKAVAFLEIRKRELEDGIQGLEKNIGLGIQMMEQLEDSEDFIQLAQKTDRKK